MGRELVVVLASPPTTSGAMTLGRVARAAEIIEAESWRVVNICPVPTRDVNEISVVAVTSAQWAPARPSMQAALVGASDLLLAYGTTEPTGAVRGLWREQVAWLMSVAKDRALRTWTWDGLPRHPSRWQRYKPGGMEMADSYSAMLRADPPAGLVR